MSNIFNTSLLKTKASRDGADFPTAGFFNKSLVKTFGLPLAFMLSLSGCQAPAVKPQAQQLQQISKILVVPVESPPLEVIPDLIQSRIPAYKMYGYETVPSSLLMTNKLYRNPGGILIAGMVGESETVDADDSLQLNNSTRNTASLEPSTKLLDYWSPSQILAQDAAKQLTTDGIKAILSEYYYRLPVSSGNRAAQHGAWHNAIKQWYGQDRSPMDYSHPGLSQIDAVLEIGIGSYRIFENQTSLKVLVKLIDPHTGQVIGRSSAETYSAEDSAPALLSRDSESFKSLIAGLGKKLVAHGLSDLGLPFSTNQVALKLDSLTTP
ncbi:MAG: hypothetical protein ACXW0L_09425 [Methylosarcina sp.]